MNEQRNLCFWHINLKISDKVFRALQHVGIHSTNRQWLSEFISILYGDEFYLAKLKPPEQTVKSVNGINAYLICLFLLFTFWFESGVVEGLVFIHRLVFMQYSGTSGEYEWLEFVFISFDVFVFNNVDNVSTFFMVLWAHSFCCFSSFYFVQENIHYFNYVIMRKKIIVVSVVLHSTEHFAATPNSYTYTNHSICITIAIILNTLDSKRN